MGTSPTHPRKGQKEHAVDQNWIVLTALTAVAPVVWGTSYLVTTEFLPTSYPLFSALVRALPAGLLALAYSRVLPRNDWWVKSLITGALNVGLFFPLLFLAAERLPGGVAATVGAIQPVIVVMLTTVVLGERPSARAAFWAAVGVLGVGLVMLGPGAGLDIIGIGAGLGSAASLALGLILTKKWGSPQGVGSVAYAGWQLTAGGIVLVIPALLIEGVPGQIDAPAILGYLWLTLIGGILSYTLWFSGVRALPVTATSLLGLLSPLVAIALDAIVLGHLFTSIQTIGFALTLAALMGGQVSAFRREK